MKKIISVILLSCSFSALADQCQLITAAQAKQAALLMQKGSEVVSLCEPCGEKAASAKISVVSSAKAKDADYQKYQEVLVNGKSVDLAYTFVKVAPNKYVNVSKVVGCDSHGVSEKISK